MAQRRAEARICPQCGAWTNDKAVCDDCGAPLDAIPVIQQQQQQARQVRESLKRRQETRAVPGPWVAPAGQVQDGGGEAPLSPDLVPLGETDAAGSDQLQRQLIGKIMGGCRVESLIGVGGMGSVFRAHHLGLDRPVALKVLPVHLAGTSEMVERFVLEARSVANIEHPNLVQVYDIRVEEGLYFIVMQFVDGADACAQMMKQGPLPPDQALDIISQASRGLQAIHERGIIHRDLKPTNLLVSRTGLVKITDLGLVKLLGSTTEEHLPKTEARSNVPYQTRISTRIGTPAYMAPEQARRGAAVDGRADIYALGATFFHLLTGRPPFEGDSTEQIFEKQRLGPVPNPRKINPWIPTRICQVIQRMMAKSPDDRHASASNLSADLERIAASGITREGPGTGYDLSRSGLKLNAFVVSTVLDKKLASRDQINELLRLQAEFVAFGSPRSLLEIFREKGILNEAQVQEMLDAFMTSELQRHNNLFGRIAVAAELLTREGLRDGFKAQRDLARAGREPMKLGEILVRKGFLTADMIDVILRAQENYLRNIDDSFFEQAARQKGVDRNVIVEGIRSLHAAGGDDPRSLVQVLVEQGHLTAVQAQDLVAEQVRRVVDVMAIASPQPKSDATPSPMDSGEWSPARLRTIASELPGHGAMPGADLGADSAEIQPGPWGWLSPGAEASDRVSLQTLIEWVRRGSITRDSMVRGPTTGGRWTFASHTPGISKHLGLCPHCQGQVEATQETCRACGRFVDWPAYMNVSEPLSGPGDDGERPLREWING